MIRGMKTNLDLNDDYFASSQIRLYLEFFKIYKAFVFKFFKYFYDFLFRHLRQFELFLQ